MGVASWRAALVAEVLSTAITAFLIIWSFWAALTGAANFGLMLQPLNSQRARVQWIAPDGPAWSVGLRPDVIVRIRWPASESQSSNTPHWAALTRGSAGAATYTLSPARVPPIDSSDVMIFALGLGMLALGVVVLVKSADAGAGWAFWRMSLYVGAALAFVPAGSRGIWWVLVAQFIALRLAGPAIVAVAWALPARPDASRADAPAWLWLPACLLLVVYPACWRWPTPVFAFVQPLDGIALLGYVIAASLLLVMHWWHSRTDHLEQAQLRLITVGIAGGFAPFLLFTVLPLLVAGQAILPFEVSILALALLPLCVAVAIVRAEFLGITGLVHRRPLRLIIGSILLASIGAGAWIASTSLTRTLGWEPPLVTAAVCVPSALIYSLLYRAVPRHVESFLLRDTYDPGRAFLELSVELTGAASASALATCAVESLGALLDLTCAALVSATAIVPYHHPRSMIPAPMVRAAFDQLQDQLRTESIGAIELRPFARLPCLLVPLHAPVTMSPADASRHPEMVLCLGPKRSGDAFTAQDRALLTTLARHLSILQRNHALHDELDVRLHDLERLVAERSALTERLITISERERRELAAALHDDAIQLAGQVERLLGDVVAERESGSEGGSDGVTGELVGAAWRLSHEVTGHLRDVVSALHPPPLDMVGLVPALQSLLRDAERRTEVMCSFVHDSRLAACRLPHKDERLLYQLTREAVGNALRHAEARTVQVELGLANGSDGARLIVRDDGKGFVPRPLGHWLAAGHLGLALLYERVQEIGGHVQVVTALGAGTTVTIELPSSADFVSAEQVTAERKEDEIGEYSYRGRR